jgi:hypothetical protein
MPDLPTPPELTLTGWLTEILGHDPHRGPFCETGRMMSLGEFAPVRGWRAIGLRLLGVNLRGRAAA